MRKITGVFGFSLGTVAAVALPFIASAQAATGIPEVIIMIQGWLVGVIGLLIVVAILVFFWGLIKYLTAVGEEKHKGLIIMFYGILTIFVMVSLWGLVNFFKNALAPIGVNNNVTPTLKVPGNLTSQ